ncbi:hypothetical protein DBA20_15470 [Pandoraea capi]|nr:hypothetical protein [Pandoraea sp. LA3]MDN4584388.1 hypothetical protein [Pandoraea capi]
MAKGDVRQRIAIALPPGPHDKSTPPPLNIVRQWAAAPHQGGRARPPALTKMDWNSDALYDPVPVTICYPMVALKTSRV